MVARRDEWLSIDDFLALDRESLAKRSVNPPDFSHGDIRGVPLHQRPYIKLAKGNCL